MRYHPDKHNNPQELHLFNEVKEAYEVLSNPGRKEIYLQERWLRKASGQTLEKGVITAPVLLKKCLELNRQISAMDAYRMNYYGMAQRIIQLLSDEVIEQLHEQKEYEIHPSIITSLVNATKPLPFVHTQQVTAQLRKLAGTNDVLNKQLDHHLLQKKRAAYWEKQKSWLVVLATVLLCLLIFFAGR